MARFSLPSSTSESSPFPTGTLSRFSVSCEHMLEELLTTDASAGSKAYHNSLIHSTFLERTSSPISAPCICCDKDNINSILTGIDKGCLPEALNQASILPG